MRALPPAPIHFLASSTDGSMFSEMMRAKAKAEAPPPEVTVDDHGDEVDPEELKLRVWEALCVLCV